jgi:hypothetical protein
MKNTITLLLLTGVALAFTGCKCCTEPKSDTAAAAVVNLPTIRIKTGSRPLKDSSGNGGSRIRVLRMATIARPDLAIANTKDAAIYQAGVTA